MDGSRWCCVDRLRPPKNCHKSGSDFGRPVSEEGVLASVRITSCCPLIFLPAVCCALFLVVVGRVLRSSRIQTPDLHVVPKRLRERLLLIEDYVSADWRIDEYCHFEGVRAPCAQTTAARQTTSRRRFASRRAMFDGWWLNAGSPSSRSAASCVSTPANSTCGSTSSEWTSFRGARGAPVQPGASLQFRKVAWSSRTCGADPIGVRLPNPANSVGGTER
jgi:hypothetical protein